MIVTLTTEYGLRDYFVPILKANLLKVLTNQDSLIDISHQITPFDHYDFLYNFKNSLPHFPPDTVHLVSVDTIGRDWLIATKEQQIVIIPNNGLLYGLGWEDATVFKITEFLFKSTFIELRLFPMIIKEIAEKREISEISNIILTDKIVEKKYFNEAIISDAKNIIYGNVIYIDHLENAVTNITKKQFDHFENKNFTIILPHKDTIKKIREEYLTREEAENNSRGGLGAIFNNAGLLEIYVLKPNPENGAHTLYDLNVGNNITIQFD